MKYIIESAQSPTNLSYLVEDGKISYIKDQFTYFHYMRICAKKFSISPGHVMIDFSIAKINDFYTFKERMGKMIMLGCTCFITAVEIDNENLFEKQLKKGRHLFVNSSLDFVVGLKISFSRLTPTFIRKCRKEKIPILFISVTETDDLDLFPWQRIRDELFPYHVFIIPIWEGNMPERRRRSLQEEWLTHTRTNKITTIIDEVKEHSPLLEHFLMNVGLYPKKGSLRIGSDADYLMFYKDGKNSNELMVPDVVFANGRVKKAGEYLFISPGIGQEITINVPKRFIPISKAFDTRPVFIDYF